jgi:hypothetical protein
MTPIGTKVVGFYTLGGDNSAWGIFANQYPPGDPNVHHLHSLGFMLVGDKCLPDMSCFETPDPANPYNLILDPSEVLTCKMYYQPTKTDYESACGLDT